MQELMNSMVKFSAAMTMFGMQQMRNTAEMAVEPQAAMKKFQASIDAVTSALGSTLDEQNKEGADKMSKVGADLVEAAERLERDDTRKASVPGAMLEQPGLRRHRLVDAKSALERLSIPRILGRSGLRDLHNTP